MPTTSDYLTQLQQDREDLVDNLETQGIDDLTGDETFTELVPKVLDIQTGGGDVPEKGVIFSEWDSECYPHKAELVGRNIVGSYFFAPQQNGTLGITYKLENIKLPTTSTQINNNAFYNLKNLISVNLPDTITSIGQYAFYGCTSLALTSLPNQITSIGLYTFYGCTNLALTSLPNRITTILNYAFQKCTNLALESLPNTITSLGYSAFDGCTNLALTSLPDGITTIQNACFRGCTNLALESLPSNVTTINADAFVGCSNLKFTTVPDTLATINGSGFYGCPFKKISMNGIRYLEGNVDSNGAFRNCANLKQVWLGSNVYNNGMKRYVFYTCPNLEKIYINLPRATVEAFANYQYAFMNDTTKTGIIICNDDPDFIDKETFDAIDVDTL